MLGPSGKYVNIIAMIAHYGVRPSTGQTSKEVIACPASTFDGAGHCQWRACRHINPSKLNPKDPLKPLSEHHTSDLAQRAQAEPMLL